MTLVEIVAARLREAFPTRAVFEFAIPTKSANGGVPPPPRCYIVSANVGDEESSTMADAKDLRSPVLWVRATSLREDPWTAANEASNWAADAREALRGFRPTIGRTAWKLDHLVSAQPFSETGLPDSSWSATEQWLALHQL